MKTVPGPLLKFVREMSLCMTTNYFFKVCWYKNDATKLLTISFDTNHAMLQIGFHNRWNWVPTAFLVVQRLSELFKTQIYFAATGQNWDKTEFAYPCGYSGFGNTRVPGVPGYWWGLNSPPLPSALLMPSCFPHASLPTWFYMLLVSPSF